MSFLLCTRAMPVTFCLFYNSYPDGGEMLPSCAFGFHFPNVY